MPKQNEKVEERNQEDKKIENQHMKIRKSLNQVNVNMNSIWLLES